MNFWKEHSGLRIFLILLFFFLGLLLVFTGWGMTGEMKGLILMLLGLVFLLAALFVYNASFRTLKKNRK